MDHVDGNAVAGALTGLVDADATSLRLTCGVCAHRHRLAETHLYQRCPGLVLRCPACAAVELVVVQRPTGPLVTFLALGGLAPGDAEDPDVTT